MTRDVSHHVRDVPRDSVVVSLDAVRRQRKMVHPVVVVDCGGGWYHDAAIAEEKSSSRQPVH